MRIALGRILGCLVFFYGGLAAATTLISNSGYGFATGVTPNNGLFAPHTVKAMGFDLSIGATNVTISASIGALPGKTPGSLTAYLVQSLGSSVPPIAQTIVTTANAVDGTASPTVLFTGLTLTAGQYYVLLIDATSTDYWQYATTQVLANGVFTDGHVWKALNPSSSPWSTPMTSYPTAPTDQTVGVGYAFSVTGIPLSYATLIANNGYSFAGVTPNNGAFNPNHLKAMAFTLAQSITNVVLQANVGATPGHTPGVVYAYLLQALGSSNPPIAQTTLSPPTAADGQAPPTTLFSGLSLSAGTYYLLLYDATTTDYWQASSNQMLGIGVTTDGYLYKGAMPSGTGPVWSTTMTSFQLSADATLGYGYAFTGIGTAQSIPPAPTTYPSVQTCGSSPVELQLYALRQQVGVNDAGVAAGDQLQVGSYCIIGSSGLGCASPGANAGIFSSASLDGNSFTLGQANDATNPNHVLAYVPVANSQPPAGPWQIGAGFGSGGIVSTLCDTPPLVDANGLIAPVVAAPPTLSFGIGAGGPTQPIVTFTEPSAFLAAATTASGGGVLRFQIWDLQPSGGGSPQIIYANNSNVAGSSFSPQNFDPSTAIYSFSVPATLNSAGYSLQLGHPYAIEIQSMLARQSGTGYGYGNPNIFSRSRIFADYTPTVLPTGVSSVSLPTVNPTGSATQTPQYSFIVATSATTPVFIETPTPISQTLTFTIGATDPNFYSIQAPLQTAFDGASVYVQGSGGTPQLVGVLSGGTPVVFANGGVSSFELVLPGGTVISPAIARRSASGRTLASSGGGGAAVLGIGFTAMGTFTGTATPGAGSSSGTSTDLGVTDGPIPLWALGALGAGLVGIASRRNKSPPDDGSRRLDRE